MFTQTNKTLFIIFSITLCIVLILLISEYTKLIIGVFGIGIVLFIVIKRQFTRYRLKPSILKGLTARAIILNCKKVKLGKNRTQLSLSLQAKTKDGREFICSSIHRIFNHEIDGFKEGKELTIKIHPQKTHIAFILTSLSFKKDKSYKGNASDEEIKKLITEIAETNYVLHFSGKDCFIKGGLNANYSGLTINGNELWYIAFSAKNVNYEAREIINRHYHDSLINKHRQLITRNSKGEEVEHAIIISKEHPNLFAYRKNLKGGYVHSAANGCWVIIILLAMIALILWDLFA